MSLLLGLAIGGTAGYLIGSESTIKVQRKRNPTNWLARNPLRVIPSEAEHKKRVQELRKAGCKPKIHKLPDTKVVTKNKGCPI